MQKAVFLDRDGVIIKERGEYNYLPEHLLFVDGIEEALLKIQNAGYILIVITNQGGIAKGIYTHLDVKTMHQAILDHFLKHHILITAFYYCPHHRDFGSCICRKPDSLMLEKAMHVYNIDPDKSFIFGDSERDILAGEKAGLQSIRIKANDNLNNYLDGL